jgi:nucleoside-diphosphate-sugar epimerase
VNAVLNPKTKLQASVSRSGLDGAEVLQLVQRNEAVFRHFSDASLLITGATGWFGVWLLDVMCAADDLLRLGMRITAVSRDPSRFLARFRDFADESRITWICADIREFDARQRDYTHIIHAATDSGAVSGPEASSRLFDTIVDGARRIIGAAGKQCRGVLLLSSGAIYGPARPGCLRFAEAEAAGPDPSCANNTYAEGKRAAEQVFAIAATMGVPVRIARCFAFVGPHMPFDAHFAIGNFIADAVQGRPIRIKSDGRAVRSYLYMTDLICALLVILAKGTVARPYNVGSDAPVTINQLAQSVDRVVGGYGVVIGGALSDPGDRYVPDTTRLRTELDFNPQVTLDSAISRTAAWYREKCNAPMSP